MPIPRCEHGVYTSGGDGDPSDYCSGCAIPTMSLTALSITRYEAVHFEGGWMTADDGEHIPMPALTAEELGYEQEPHEKVDCPACWSPMTIVDEYDFECAACGFNGL